MKRGTKIALGVTGGVLGVAALGVLAWWLREECDECVVKASQYGAATAVNRSMPCRRCVEMAFATFPARATRWMQEGKPENVANDLAALALLAERYGMADRLAELEA